jgi:hypothetical protein
MGKKVDSLSFDETVELVKSSFDDKDTPLTMSMIKMRSITQYFHENSVAAEEANAILFEDAPEVPAPLCIRPPTLLSPLPLSWMPMPDARRSRHTEPAGAEAQVLEHADCLHAPPPEVEAGGPRPRPACFARSRPNCHR